MNNNNSKLLNGGLDMKVTKIESRKDDYIDLSLTKGYINEYLFEDHYINIHISDVEPIDYLYRRMFEERYLRRKYDKYDISNIPENGNMVMKLSVSEAIAFVKAALPPVFKGREKELYNSYDALEESLATFLDGGDSQYEYMSLFRKYTGLNYFETKTDYDFNRMNMLRKFNPSGPIVDFMVFTEPLKEIYDGIEGDELEDYEGSLYREPTGVAVHLMFNCIKKSELSLIYKMIEESRYYYLNGLCTIKILNIFHNEFGGYYVELFVDNYDSDVLKTLQDIFVSTYKPILSN